MVTCHGGGSISRREERPPASPHEACAAERTDRGPAQIRSLRIRASKAVTRWARPDLRAAFQAQAQHLAAANQAALANYARGRRVRSLITMPPPSEVSVVANSGPAFRWMGTSLACGALLGKGAYGLVYEVSLPGTTCVSGSMPVCPHTWVCPILLVPTLLFALHVPFHPTRPCSRLAWCVIGVLSALKLGNQLQRPICIWTQEHTVYFAKGALEAEGADYAVRTKADR